MQLKVYKSLWGMSGGTANFARIASAGFDGIESAVAEISDNDRFRSMLAEFGLGYIPLIYTEGNSPAEHLADFERLVSEASKFVASKIIAHFGRDLWSFDDQLRFFEKALRIEEQFGIPIAHETHRRRPLFSPMNTVNILKRLPTLKITADLSHWCCVTESMLEDHEEAIALVAKNAIHIHSRVGYENSPQVSDPRLPQWAGHVAKFEGWWKQIIAEATLRGDDVMSITPEYGPPSYQQTDPITGKPVADHWEICLWAKERIRKFEV